MNRSLTDCELVCLAIGMLRLAVPADSPDGPGTIVWHEAVRRVASHLKAIQQRGAPLPAFFFAGPDAAQATAELLQHVRDELVAGIVAEAARCANGESS